jgi:hypothetical protein
MIIEAYTYLAARDRAQIANRELESAALVLRELGATRGISAREASKALEFATESHMTVEDLNEIALLIGSWSTSVYGNGHTS